ncbi:MAG TPA: glyoxylate/hydroxypyruvate reductase A, partial [Candidatus Cybelea sp.]|nr:glyoxylate/hydroxypyruvate reductase A [Candidatus Cybelea sp.]
MTLLFMSKIHNPAVWTAALRHHLPDLEIAIWPEVGDPSAVEFALVWSPKPGELRRYPNLKAVFSFGAGVEHIFADAELPPVPVVKVVDARLTKGLTEYVLLHVLRQHRRLDLMRRAQDQARWIGFATPDTRNTTVGIMGLGEIGRDAAFALVHLGFRVAGWSRTPKDVPGVEGFHGPGGLDAFLKLSRFLVCLLPLTPDTRGILNRERLALLPRGAHLINAGRGPLVVDEDLIAALDSGHIASATLDVFHREPLPPAHAFWSHPKVTVTPHNASDTVPDSVAAQIADNIRRAKRG